MSSVFSFAPRASIQIGLLMVLFMASYFLVTTFVNSKKRLRTILFLFCTSALFTGLYGLYQNVSGQVDTTWTDQELFEGLNLRVYSTFGNPNVYAEYLLLAIPVAVIMAYLVKKPLAKAYYLGIGAVLLASLALTYSRGCYLRFWLPFSSFFALWRENSSSRALRGFWRCLSCSPRASSARFQSILNFSDTSTSYRIQIWKGSVAMLKDYFLPASAPASRRSTLFTPLIP